MKNRCKIATRLSTYSVVFKVIKEGAKFRDKVVLFLSIFYSLARYVPNKIRHRMRLCYCLMTDAIIKNSSGTFYCRAQTDDALMVSEAHEFQLRQYFEELFEGNFVDIGAHIGKYTVQIARQLQDRGRVVSVEAHPGNFGALLQNIKLNRLSNVTALNVACLDKNGKVRLYRDSSSTAASLYSTVRRFRGDYISVDAKKLDDILSECKIDVVDLMKVDIEGAEAKCFKGVQEFLKENKINKVLFECNWEVVWEECKSILEQYGYAIKHVGVSYYLAESRGFR